MHLFHNIFDTLGRFSVLPKTNIPIKQTNHNQKAK